MTSWLLGVPVVLILLFGCLVLPHNLRMWRCRRDHLRLPPRLIQEVVALIEEKGAANPILTLMLPEDGGSDGVALGSHLGGEPYAQAGESWPGAGDPESEPATFVGQFVLVHPGLPDVWENRLLTVFLEDDAEQTVRSYAEPAMTRCCPLEGGPIPNPCVPLRGLSIPAGETGGPDDPERPEPFEPVALLTAIPEVKRLLGPHTADAEGVLAQILAVGRAGYSLDASSVVYQGGAPSLIQNPHDPKCPQCSTPMRFLLQVGDVVPGVVLGDAGVLYVYGCDRHPERCTGYVDSH